jgi:hypothetical protein
VDDDFTRRLLGILQETKRRGLAQEKVLGILRSDYMLHDQGNGAALAIHQVELNRISCAFPALSSFVTQMHGYLLRHFEPVDRPDFRNIPENKSLDETVDGLHHAWQLFGNEEAVVLMVVQEGEKNAADQRHLEYRLWNKHKVALLRRSLQALGARGVLDGKRNLMMYRVIFRVYNCLQSIFLVVITASLQSPIFVRAIDLRIIPRTKNGKRDWN